MSFCTLLLREGEANVKRKIEGWFSSPYETTLCPCWIIEVDGLSDKEQSTFQQNFPNLQVDLVNNDYTLFIVGSKADPKWQRATINPGTKATSTTLTTKVSTSTTSTPTPTGPPSTVPLQILLPILGWMEMQGYQVVQEVEFAGLWRAVEDKDKSPTDSTTFFMFRKVSKTTAAPTAVPDISKLNLKLKQ